MTPFDGEYGGLRFRRSLASRVTLLTTLAVAAAIAFVAVGAYVLLSVMLRQTYDDSLLGRARSAAKAGLLQELIASGDTEGRLTTAALGAGDLRMAYIDPFGQMAERGDGPSIRLGAAEFRVAFGRSDQSLRTVRTQLGAYRVVAVPSPNGGALVLEQSLESQERVLDRLGTFMTVGGLMGVVGAGFAGWLVARNGLRPVRRLTLRVEETARTDDLTPLRIEGDDEIARLGAAFNSLLASVAASRLRQRQLVADAGHELRTPLTSLRTNLDLLAMADEGGAGLPPEARSELLGDVRAQLEELSTLIGDLVELARDDPSPVVVEAVDLAEVVERSVRRVRRRATTVEFDTHLSPWVVQGESFALERAVTNLLDNAAKWSPPEGRVEIRLVDGVLTVADQGPGIPARDLPHVFDRFYRATESRSMPGSGLGLSIVRQVVERHGGQVRADTGPSGGALLTMRIPPAPVPAQVLRA